MAIIKRGIRVALLLLFFNLTLLLHLAPLPVAIPAIVVLAVFYMYYNIRPIKDRAPDLRLGMLHAGSELTLAGIACLGVEVAGYLYLILGGMEIPLHILMINALVFLGLLLTMTFNGIIRIFVCSKQLSITSRVCLLLFWWVPVVNILLLRKMLVTSRTEYQFATHRYRLNENRRQEELCRTKYPILMVHGIFFRDWKHMNYWGRIPKELIDNGATIYYGNQRSTASVAECAEELRRTIERIIAETGCEKLNIIAHSKGGLDSRYAVSALGMGHYVASLTTINTPHRGCNYVKKLLEKIPEKAVNAIGKQYETVFARLGDDEPDFFSGLQDLTDTECARLGELMPDVPGVLYQSVGSRMRSAGSAIFPLSLGYSIIKLSGGGENDGLVSTTSMEWGNFLGLLTPTGKLGISHGDVIDLTRKNVPGFDVCEFYVDLVHKLKLGGL